MILTFVLGLFAVGVVGVLSLLPALQIQRELLRAKSAVEAGRDAMFAGDLARSRDLFDDAASSFIKAGSSVHSPFLNLASKLPIVGRTPDAIAAMASAGASVAAGGSALATFLERVPGGLAALSPHDGQMNLQLLKYLRPTLFYVNGAVNLAQQALDSAERSWVLPPVAAAARQFDGPLRTLSSAMRAATLVAVSLPGYLGDGGTRHYFVAAQNPAELRGTGGFIGSYAVLTATQGHLRFSSFEPIETLPDAVGQVRAPNADYAARYNGFGGAGFWRNINMTPDFPSAAVAIERLYRQVRGVKLDGVIAADPQALAALLSATGPVAVPALGTTLDAKNVVAYTTNTAYSVIRDPEQRKHVLGDAAKATFDRFVKGSANGGAAMIAMTRTIAEGHLSLQAVDPTMQQAFLTANIAGGLASPPGDFVAVSATNAAANKLDYYVQRKVHYVVRLNADGSARSDLEVSLDNPSPTSGEPDYVIGPFPGASEVGESVSYLSTYCGATCELDRHTVDGRATPVGVERELGHRVFSEFVHVPAGEHRTLGYQLRVPEAWLGDDLSGVYRITIQDQPSLIRPTLVTLEIHAPPGTAVSFTSEPMQVHGGVAIWTGPAGKARQIRVEFQRPLSVRAWTRFLRFLVKPLF